MKTRLQKALARIAPSIALEIVWTRSNKHDADPVWRSWAGEVCATAIWEGEAYRSRSRGWKVFVQNGSSPADNPEAAMDGREPTLVQDALENLDDALPINARQAQNEVRAALNHVKTVGGLAV